MVVFPMTGRGLLVLVDYADLGGSSWTDEKVHDPSNTSPAVLEMCRQAQIVIYGTTVVKNIYAHPLPNALSSLPSETQGTSNMFTRRLDLSDDESRPRQMAAEPIIVRHEPEVVPEPEPEEIRPPEDTGFVGCRDSREPSRRSGRYER